MRERVAQLGGVLHIESAPGEGTTVAVEMPAPAGRPEVAAGRPEEAVEASGIPG